MITILKGKSRYLKSLRGPGLGRRSHGRSWWLWDGTMRLGEMLALTRDDLDLLRRQVTVQTSKNGDKRHVPLTRRTLELFQMVEDRPQAFLQVGRDVASVMFRPARIDAEIEELSFHHSRHKALTRLARKLDVLDLARMVGHRDPRSLMIYYNATATEIASRLD